MHIEQSLRKRHILFISFFQSKTILLGFLMIYLQSTYSRAPGRKGDNISGSTALCRCGGKL